MRRHSLLPVVLLFPAFVISAQDFDELNNQAYRESVNKNYYKAIDLCNQALNKKINARSYIIRADNYYNLDKYELAIEDYNSALTYYYDSYGSEEKEKGWIYYFRGRSKQELYRYNDAITDFNSALSYNYKEPGYTYWNRGACFYDLRDYQKADEDYVKAIERISKKNHLSTLWTNRGDCQASLGAYEKAWDYYAKGIEYDPNNYSPYWQRGHFKDQQYKYEEALADYNKAIEILVAAGSTAKKSDLASIYESKSNIHILLKQYNEALAAFEKSIEINPNLPEYYIKKAGIYESMKNIPKARVEYDNAITLETEDKKKSNIYLTRSMMYWELLDYKNCMTDLNKAIELDPADGMNFWHRSMLYGYKKNYLLALKDCNTAMELYSNDSSSTASLLWLRAEHKTKSGDYNGAKQDYQLYLKYYPDSYGAYYELGRLFKHHIKNNDLANANLAKAQEMAWAKKDTSRYCYIRVIKGETFEPFMIMGTKIENSAGKEFSYKWNLHNMACMYSLAGNAAKGLEYLEKSMAAGFDDYRHLVNDWDLALLMKLPQWKIILAKYKVPVIMN